MEIRKDPGRIVTFYSYKGGTGRSMALANVAWLLAAAGKRVLMIDWDLEAPGLHRYVHPFLDDPALTTSEGVIDFVISYTEEASSKKLDENLDPKWFAPYANITRFAIPLDYAFPAGGSLDFIPAGKQGRAYAGRVNSFNWKDFYVRLGGRAVLEEARARLRENYEYILIDSRTGVSDTSGICTVEMPDAVVVCFTLNMQSVSGAAAAARSMLEQRPPDRPLDLFPVAMRVVDAELEKTIAVREYAKEQFLHLMSDTSVEPQARDEYWHEVEVRQVAFYAFEEQMAYFRDSPNDPSAVLSSMKRLTWRMSRVDVRNLPGPEPARRDEILAIYAGVWAKAEAPKAAEAPKRFVYVSHHEYSVPAMGSPAYPADAVPGGAEVATAADVPRTGSWLEAFRSVLRRSAAMAVIVDERGIGPNQQRELAVAFDYQARAGGARAFPITVVPAEGARAGQYPGLATPDGRQCPYPGLRPFRIEDTAVFFGQEGFIEKLVEQMQTAPAIVLGGQPGSGKSSAIAAGLIPRLLLQEAPRPVWKVVICDVSISAHYSQAIVADALVRARGTARFEEQVRKETADLMGRLSKEGTGILKDVVASVLSAWPPANRLAIILETGSPKFDPALFTSLFRDAPDVSFVIVSESPGSGQITLPPLSSEDLIRAMEQPALRAGTTLEPGLAARIAAEFEGQEEVLALLQFCMTRLWFDRRGAAGDRTIRRADYDAIGGIRDMIEVWAEAHFAALTATEQQPALRLLCRLAVRPDPLRAEDIPEALRATVEKLVERRMLGWAVGIEGARWYSLFPLARRWPRLQKAIAENASYLTWRARFRAPMDVDQGHGRYSALLRGEALATARQYLAERPQDFTVREVDFIHRSEAEARAPATAAAAAPKGRSVAFVIAAGGLLAFAALAVYFFFLRPAAQPPAGAALLATAYREQQEKNYSAAIAHLTQSLRLAPEPALVSSIYSLRAYCYKREQDWEKSIADLTAALSAVPPTPDQVRLLEDRGYAYIQVRKPAEALMDYTAAVKLAPSGVDAAYARQFLAQMLTPTGRGNPPVFVIMKPIQRLSEVPAPVRKLYPQVSFLNIRGWTNPIPENELRYNDPNDEGFARQIVERLDKAAIHVKGPLPVPPAAGRRIELWLSNR